MTDRNQKQKQSNIRISSVTYLGFKNRIYIFCNLEPFFLIDSDKCSSTGFISLGFVKYFHLNIGILTRIQMQIADCKVSKVTQLAMTVQIFSHSWVFVSPPSTTSPPSFCLDFQDFEVQHQMKPLFP